MAPPRTFDYDVLNQIVRDHPGWSNIQYAQVMTEYERRVRRDPGYKPIMPNAIARAISQSREIWRAEGKPVRDRPRGRLVPWPGIPKDYQMDTCLRHLKTLERMRLGLVVPARGRRQALIFGERLRKQRKVVDIRADGKPYERLARPHELDEDGNLVKLTADVRPDWLARTAPNGIEDLEHYLGKLEALQARD